MDSKGSGTNGLTRRQSQRPRPSRLLLTYVKSNETTDSAIEACRSRAGRGRGSSLTLGKNYEETFSMRASAVSQEKLRLPECDVNLDFGAADEINPRGVRQGFSD